MSTTTAEASPRLAVGDLVRGAVGGIIAGMVFAAVTMWFVTTQKMSALTPLHMISTIVKGDQAMMTGATSVPIGLVVHMVLSMMFGVVFALAVSRLRTNGAVALAGLVFGLLLYVVNFQILGRLLFTTFLMANQPFEVLAHLVFGSLLALFLYSTGPRRGEPLWG